MESLTGLRADSASDRFTFQATPELCVPGMFVFGGATASAVVEAIEATCERPLAWVTTQFQRRVEPGATVELAVTKDVERPRLVQCRVEATVEGETVARALAAAAERAPDPLVWGEAMPSAAPPGECRPLAFREGWMEGGFPSRFEWRLAGGRRRKPRQHAAGGGDGADGVVATEPTEWMLLDCSIRAHVGVAHVEIVVWTESGALLGLHTTTALHGRG